MGLFSHTTRPEGLIGELGLSDWWLVTFTPQERRALATLYDERAALGPRLARLTTGRFKTSLSASALLLELATLAEKSLPRLLPALLAKGEDLAIHSGNVLDLHFLYGFEIKVLYRARDRSPGALEAAIACCERQISLAPQAATAWLAQYGPRVPSHDGFRQLAIIREKRGDFAEALRLCREARSQGWADGRDDWSKRMARLECRAAEARS